MRLLKEIYETLYTIRSLVYLLRFCIRSEYS